MLRPKGKRIWSLWVMLLIFLGYFLFWGTASTVQTQEENICISSYPSVKDLVKITREIAE